MQGRRAIGGRLVLLIAVAIGAVAAIASEIEGDTARGTELGRPEVVFDWTKDACDEYDTPDLPARAFRRADGRVQLTFSAPLNRRMIGDTLDRLRHRCRAVMASDADPRPGAFNDHEWIASPYTVDGRTVFALVHNEFHGYLRPALCPSRKYQSCWYNSVTLAVSRDQGTTFSDARPAPGHVVATLPYQYVAESGPVGFFEPSNIIFRRADRHFYALVRTERYRDQQRGACLMRTRNLADPGSWRAWDGSGFNVRFTSPYAGAGTTPATGVCRPLDRIQGTVQSISYNTYLSKYMLVGVGFETQSPRPFWGVYYSLSDDLIDWSAPRLIRETELPWTYRCGDRDPILYPSLLDPDSDSRNFETVGKSAYLYYTQLHYKDCKQGPDRDLMRIPIEFN